jgi:general secretion pathway protein G
MKHHRILRAARRSRAGFSLAELMVVIVIIGLLATLVVPALMDRLGAAYETKAKVDIKQIEDALTTYATMNTGTYPDSLEQLIEPDENGRRYLQAEIVPKDPWKREYLYEPPTGGRSTPLVMSYGKDGSPGGEGADRDLSNEMIHRGEL